MRPHEQTGRQDPARWKVGLLLLLTVLAAISAGAGAWNGVHHSQDFQWSGARVFDAHVDPWAEYLRGDPQHRFVLSQVPNYLALVYVLLSPLGLLPLGAAKLAWVVANLIFAVTSGAISAHFYGMRGRRVAVVVCLLLMATPVRNSIGNGQQGLLVLMVWCLGLITLRMSDAGAATAGLSYGKFTFAPPVFVFLLFRCGWRAALWSLVPAFACLAVAWIWLAGWHDGHALLRLAGEPFAVAKAGYTWSGGDQDLMRVLDPALRSLRENTRNGIELAFALGACTTVSYFAFYRRRDAPVAWQIALTATMSYGLFKHHSYDAVVLLFPLCLALNRWRERQAWVVLALIGYLFYGQRVLEAAHLHPAWSFAPEFVMVMAILAVTYRLQNAERVHSPSAKHRVVEGRLAVARQAGQRRSATLWS